MSDGDPGIQIVRLKAPSVVCQVSACGKSAEFLLKKPPHEVRALCREHAKALGIREDDLPPEEPTEL